MTVSTFDLINAFSHGDIAYLTDLVRNDVQMPPKVRSRLADLLLNVATGKWRRPAKRPRGGGSMIKRETIASDVGRRMADGWKATAATARAAELYDCSPRWVSAVVKEQSELSTVAAEAIAMLDKHSAASGSELREDAIWYVFTRVIEAN